MSNRLLQILASLAQRRALRTLDTICETQHQISTRKLGQYLEPIGDELAGHAFHLRMEYDALTSKIAQLEAELAKLRAGQEPVAVVKESQYLLGDTSDEISELLPIGTKLYTAPQPSAVPDMIELAAFIRQIDGNNRMGAGVLAERICEWIAATSAPATAQGDGWIPVSERLPESERTVLAFYLNSHGKGRRVRAEYIAAKTKSADDGWDSDEPADYDEQADEYFWPAGWYEVMDNWDDLTHMVIHEGEVTHWMPLPAAPGRQEVK